LVIYPLVALPFANTTDWNGATENIETVLLLFSLKM